LKGGVLERKPTKKEKKEKKKRKVETTFNPLADIFSISRATIKGESRLEVPSTRKFRRLYEKAAVRGIGQMGFTFPTYEQFQRSRGVI
jgi:hypothetical protein